MRWLVCIAVFALAGCASAPLAPEVEAGRKVAQSGCSGCHGMTPDRPSIDRRAPPFWRLAGRHTPDSLMQATRTTPAHDPLAMPSVVISRADAAALMAYMKALGSAPKSAWRQLDVAPCISTLRC